MDRTQSEYERIQREAVAFESPTPEAAPGEVHTESTDATEQQRIKDEQTEARRQAGFRDTDRAWRRIQEERAEQRAGAGYRDANGTWVSARHVGPAGPPGMYGVPPEPPAVAPRNQRRKKPHPSPRSTFPMGWMWSAVGLLASGALAYLAVPEEAQHSYMLGWLFIVFGSCAGLAHEWSRRHTKKTHAQHPASVALRRTSVAFAVCGLAFLALTIITATRISKPLMASLVEDEHVVTPIKTATPPPRAPGVDYLPSDTATFNAIHQMSLKRGYRIASSPEILRLTLRNDGPTIWATYKLGLTIHYEMRSAVDWRDIADHVDQDVPISNCQFSPGKPLVPVSCDGTQVRPGETYSLSIVNASAAYAVVEFPDHVDVQEPGSESVKRAWLNIAGRDMIFPTKLRQIILPPFRAPGDPT